MCSGAMRLTQSSHAALRPARRSCIKRSIRPIRSGRSCSRRFRRGCWPAPRIGRASDYLGPRGGQQSNLGDRVFLPALDGKTAQVLGDPEMLHTYTYIPDIGSSLVVLGQHDEALGEVWHLPNAAAQSTRELVEIAYRATGHPLRLRAAPNLMVRAIGLVNPMMRELTESPPLPRLRRSRRRSRVHARTRPRSGAGREKPSFVGCMVVAALPPRSACSPILMTPGDPSSARA